MTAARMWANLLGVVSNWGENMAAKPHFEWSDTPVDKCCCCDDISIKQLCWS